MEEALPDRRFHAEMLSIFTSLRDLHTLYKLPPPYNKFEAFLPFQMEEAFRKQTKDSCFYIVTKVLNKIDSSGFGVGAEILYWNGVPISHAVELVAERANGSNPYARHARGVEYDAPAPGHESSSG